MTFPVRVTQFPTTLLPDAPLVQDALYRLDKQDRAYIDGQILGIQSVIAKGSNGNALLLQGVPISSSAPTSGQVLVFNGTQWAPTSGSGITLAGDVTGTDAATLVSKIQGITVDQTTMSAAGDTNFIQKLAGAWKAITVAAASVALLGASVSNTATNTQVLVGTGASTANWAAASSITSGSVTPGTSGQVYVTNATPAAVWTSLIQVTEFTHGRFQIGGAGSDFKMVIGPLVGSETVASAVYALAGATAPTGSNYTFYGDGVNAVVSAPSGNIAFQFTASTFAVASGSGGNTFNFQGASTTTAFVLGTTSTSQSTITINATQAAATTSGGNITIAPQAGGATSGIPGSLIANIAVPNGGSTEGYFQVQRGGTVFTRIGTYPGAGFGAIWFLDAGSPSTTNWAFLGNTVSSQFNAPTSTGTLYFSIGGTPYLTIGSPTSSLAGLEFGLNYLSADYIFDLSHTAVQHFTVNATSAKIKYDAAISDVATSNLTIQGQYAFATATGTHRVPGNVIFDIGAPTNGGTTEAYVQFSRNATVLGSVGTLNISPTYGCLWLGSAAPTANNMAVLSDGSTFSYLNTATTGALGFLQNEATFLGYFPSAANIFYLGGFNASSPIAFTWATSTTPLIQSGTSATSLTVGTNKAGANFILQGDAAVTVETISGAGVAWSVSASQSANFNFSTSTGKVYWSVNTSGGAVTGTLPAASSVTAGTTWYVQDNQGSFQANAFTLAPNGADKINGRNASVPFNTNWAVILIWTDATQWFARGI